MAGDNQAIGPRLSAIFTSFSCYYSFLFSTGRNGCCKDKVFLNTFQIFFNVFEYDTSSALFYKTLDKEEEIRYSFTDYVKQRNGRLTFVYWSII